MTTIAQQKAKVQEICREWPKGLWLPVGEMQRRSPIDKPARGPIWISRCEFSSSPETALRDVLYEICERLQAPEHIISPKEDLALESVGVEFIGPRGNADSKTPEPKISEPEKMKHLEEECEGDMTILYVHGGGLYFSGPVEYRSASTQLARLTKSRVASIRYRLAPQSTFPAPLLDLLLAYTSLLYPPANATYKAVSPSQLILAGNSAGANLCLSLTKFLLEFNRDASRKIALHNRQVSLPLPAAIATVSGWMDQTDALPSWREGGENDILSVLQPALWPDYPTDQYWPSTPPREHPYARAVTLDHELVTPAAVRDWTGAPPMWFGVGSEERGLDGNRVVASQAARCGVKVRWMEYQGMPHEWMIMLRGFPQAGHCFKAWAEACREFTTKKSREEKASLFEMPGCKERDLGRVEDLMPLDFEEIRKRMKKMNLSRPIWTGRIGAKI